MPALSLEPTMPDIPPAAYEAHLYADIYRTAAAVAGVVFVLFAIKVVYLRIRHDRPPTLPLATAWGACAAFALATTGLTIERLGEPFDVVCALYGVGLALGYWSLMTTLTVAWVPETIRHLAQMGRGRARLNGG
jgi:drug/metabolite transporter (DMT)-like permease